MGNYLGVFVLGWSYVLSARLIELRQKTPGDKIVYTINQAQWGRDDDEKAGYHFDLDIGSDNCAEVRWWAAILAEGCGWEATLARDGKEYYPPWECHLNNSPFRLHHCAQNLSSISAVDAPSSAEAQGYLFNFARFHDAFDQLIVAFAAAITLPSHNRFGSSIVLPKPINRRSSCHNTQSICANQIPTTDELPHFMALSCTSGLVASCLFGCLWEPGIACNLASQWLNPPMKDIFPSFIQSKNFHSIICAMSQRRPNVASLWLGSAVTGLLPRIFQVSRTFLPTIYLEAVIWTASPQSFMDPQHHRLVPVKKMGGLDMICREDEFRLLFITDVNSETYGNPPLSPYPPFGLVNVQNTSLGVRLHLACDHRPEYHSWDWKCQNGQVLRDFGLSCGSKPVKPSFRANILQSVSSTVVITCAGLYVPLFGLRTCLQKCSVLLLSCTLSVYLLPYSARKFAYEGLYFIYYWLKGTLSVGSSIIWSKLRKDPEDDFDDRISELATRNLFSWTFFTEGIRTEEKALWKHEWLEFLLDREDADESSESSSCDLDDEAKGQKFDSVLGWQDNVAV